MLKKIIKIKNVGKFQDCRPMGDLEFQKMTLIYAENARGKTTFADILRSVQCGDPNYIVGRQTLGATDNSEIVLRFDSSNTTFSGRSWNQTWPDIAIFDSTFVYQNVFAGDFIDHSHKKNLYRVIVGEKGVKLAQRVDELDGKIREMNKEIRIKEARVKQFMPTGATVDLDKFLALPKHEDIEKRILDAEAEVTAMEQTGDILNRKPLEKIVLPVLPSNFSDLLGKTFDTVSKDAERLVRDHMSLHTNEATELWLADGLSYVKDETCPFCAQSLRDNALLFAYRTHFGLTYVKLKKEISNLQTQVNTVLGETALLTLQKVIAENQSACTFWQAFVPLKAPTISFDDQLQVPLGRLRVCCQSLIKKKMEALLEPIITPGADFTAALADYEATSRIIESYNSAVEVANKLVVERKSKAEVGNLQNAKQDLQLLKAIKQRHEPEAIQACSDYQSDVGTKNSLEDKKNNAKDELDQYTEHVFPRYQRRVNELLGKFNTSFGISGTTRSYTGGTPSSSYNLLINGVSVHLGTSNTPLDTASFRNTLSAGDRSTLALAFFIAQLEDDSHLSQKIVVFDDPITSQDRFRRTCTQQLLCNLSPSCKQVVILSHDARFLKIVWDGTMRSQVRTLQFFPMAQNTAVREWDIQDATLDAYPRDYELVTDYLTSGAGDPRQVARALRPLMEGYFRVKFPKQFKENEWLRDFIGKVRNADSSSSLYSVRNALDKIEAVKDYSKKYHHATNSGADAEPIDNGELQGYVRRALDIIHGT